MQDLILEGYLVRRCKKEKSWGRIKTSYKGNVVVYGDSSVYFPILCAHVLSKCRPRNKKNIYKYKNKGVEEMKKFSLWKNQENKCKTFYVIY